MTNRIRPLGRRDSARALLARRARRALGLPGTLDIHPEHGETPLRISLWSVRELQDAYTHVGGGAVTAQQVERAVDNISYTAIEITLTTRIPGLGTVQAFTEWTPASEAYALTLPVIQALGAPAGLR
ncbi:hypothetical protein [Streptomyces sp. R33]|uniref:Uncharacterized protein n=1 Tax=Streptomyces sp. R33 TaxID=3238629 RepID=A0AB39Y8J3_9ACTN